MPYSPRERKVRAFQKAVAEGNLPKVERWLAADSSLAKAVIKGGDTALHFVNYFAGEESLGMVECLLRAGANPNSRENFFTPFIFACCGGTVAVLHLMVDAGADVNLPLPVGKTPLHAACVGHVAAVAYLLEQGADPNVRDEKGETPLYEAVGHNNWEGLKILLAHGANIDSQNNEGNTALHHAVTNRDVQGVRFLLEHHAQLNLRNAKDQTPLSLLRQEKFKLVLPHPQRPFPRTLLPVLEVDFLFEEEIDEIVALLEAAGAKE